MGFLTDGDTLTWDESVQYQDFIKKSGVLQLINLWNDHKDVVFPGNTWGDEIEYLLLKFDDDEKTVKLALRGHEILAVLQKEERAGVKNLPALWRPEYGSFMVEGTPGIPYTYDFSSLCTVQENMTSRRLAVKALLNDGEHLITMTNFPMMGTTDFTFPPDSPGGPIAGSLFTPDTCINPHKRFGTLTNNIKTRKGSNVEINMPLFMDTNTKPLTYEEYFPELDHSPAKENHIYMDSMAFGMGQCCLQTTFQTRTIEDARFLYDQYIPIAPVFLSLTAATPIFRGYLADVDVRWDVISGGVDDRTEEERGRVESEVPVIKKSRYGGVSRYLSPDTSDYLNDLDLVYHEELRQEMLDQGFDPELAAHFAHLFIRDALVVYAAKIELDNKEFSDHFENIQSTNWQTARFKPPTPHSTFGWRVEFRPMEIQFTDFENAAFAVFVSLLTTVIVEKHINYRIPISKIDENMERAHVRGSVLDGLFWFLGSNGEVEEFSVNQIFNGGENIKGFVPLIREYIDENSIQIEQLEIIEKYIDLVSKRASGELDTNATWIRNFVQNHSEYNQDSIVTPTIAYDLLRTVSHFENGDTPTPSSLI